MYFKEQLSIRNQFEYFNLLYNFQKEGHPTFKTYTPNIYKSTNKWLNNGRIDNEYFSYNDENILDSDSIFDICYEHTQKLFNEYPDKSEILKQLVKAFVFDTASLKYSFEFTDNINEKFKKILNDYNEETLFSTLILFAQTNRIISPQKEYTDTCNIVKVYNKTDITHQFTELISNAIEIDMMQISTPSLIHKYSDFFKPDNYSSIINALKNGCIINFLFIDPESEFAYNLSDIYCYGNTFDIFGDVIKDSINLAQNLKNKYPDQVQIKTTMYPISYSLMIIKKREQPAIAKVDLYLLKKDADSRQSFIFNSENNMESYSLYRNNFFDIFNDPNNKIY